MTIAVQKTERSNFPTHVYYHYHRKAPEDAEADSRLSQGQVPAIEARWRMNAIRVLAGSERFFQPLKQTATTAAEFGDEGLCDLSVH